MTRSPAAEIPLAGGFTQKVVRVGDTVRRAPRANAQFVRWLLGELAQRGFDAVPRWLGTDERGREIFSYVEGEVPLDLGHFGDETLRHAARFIRRYHDVTAPLFEAGRVACHNDLSPCNFVFRGGVPCAVIDFDVAAEGERMFDLGYAAWTWIDAGNEDDYTPEEQLRRLALFARAYDPDTDMGALIEAMLLRQKLLSEQYFGPTRAETREWAKACRDTTLRLRALLDQ